MSCLPFLILSKNVITTHTIDARQNNFIDVYMYIYRLIYQYVFFNEMFV